ncbi:MAG: hypothetical protein JO033_00500, partial [Acidobacteriaceae bacterium]|nr:hypothetical protein [Acidobacteriaceae bacterium]
MRSTRIPVSEPRLIPDLAPKHDERLSELMQQALAGKVDVYFAAVPLCPFDLDYRPDQHPMGLAAIRETGERWKNGQFQNMLAYERGAWFVISDDYIPLFAALPGMPDYVPCWILGKPQSDHV